MTADQRVPSGRELLSGNVAAAYAVLLARARVVAAYPITPQTILVEKLAEYAPQYGIEYITVESEHSMVAAVRGSTKAGVRSFCATSSHNFISASLLISDSLILPICGRFIGAVITIFWRG